MVRDARRFGISRAVTAPCVLLSLLLSLLVASLAGARADDRQAVLIGGGPNPKSNQAAIESNVRYLLRLLPADVKRTVLFADGDPKAETVLYEEQAKPLKPGERIVTLLLDGPEAASPTTLKYRAPNLSQIDGPSRRAEIEGLFSRLSTQAPAESPLLLYFTGHGSPARNRNLDNNVYDLWQEDGLSVRDLAAQLDRLPVAQPVTLVMVQCYSGAFGNLLFRNGDPKGEPTDRDLAGFYATVKERVAAGCTPAVDESEYHDFTSYFFAALTGQDRVGRKVRGADYNHDGQVAMDEAFCYALSHDASIDIPICTSDVYLRRVVTTPDEEIFKTPYSRVKGWASPAQRAALEDISKRLRLAGDDRGLVAYNRFRGADADPGARRANPLAAARRAYNEQRDEARRALIQRWPELLDKNGAGYAKARADAAAQAEQGAKEGTYKALLDSEAALDAADDAAYKQELADSLQTRFVRLYKSVALAHAVRTGSDEAAKQRLERIVAAEGRRFLPAVKVASRSTTVSVPQKITAIARKSERFLP
jgi:hypothetical protein